MPTFHTFADPASALVSLGYHVVGYEPKPLKAVRFEEAKHGELWDNFIPRTVNGNLFHTRRFLQYHPAGRFQDHSLLFYDRDRLVGVAAGEEAEGRWTAHRFSSHGGIAVIPALTAAECLDLVWALVRHGTEAGWKRIDMRFAPEYLYTESLACLFWALEVFGFRHIGKELTWCLLPAAQDEQQLLAGYHVGQRGSIRKAQRENLTAHLSDDFPTYWGILQGNLEGRHHVAPTHSLQEILALRGLLPERVSLLAVFDRAGTMVAGATVFDISQGASHVFYLAQDYRYKHLCPMPLLMHQLFVEFALRRKKLVNLGVITAHSATEINLSLSQFKQRYGTTPAIRRSFALDLGEP